MTDSTPTGQADRIGELDIIRGFALFGVMWMNIFDIGGFVVPEEATPGLSAYAPVLEKVVGFASNIFMHGKAQALFSLLFGFGFAIMMDRIGARGGNGTRVYLRRLTILLVIGVAHLALLWIGDILHAYAAMGFLLLLTRRWPARAVLAAGLVFAWLVPTMVWAYFRMAYPDGPPPFAAMFDAQAAARLPIVMGGDYPAFVMDSLRSTVALYRDPFGLAFLGWILGRFLIGSWIYRQGWMQAPERYLKGFAVVAATFIPAGLMLQMLRPIMTTLELEPLPWFQVFLRGLGSVTPVILALGYAALIVILCQWPTVRRRLSGLGVVGQMALTNYLTQSLCCFFLIYGIVGLGWLPWMGPTLTLAFTVVVFSLQIVFSRWWLARYRFGPVEWLWRWGTYGVKPALRRA